jgi:hypothetical protein
VRRFLFTSRLWHQEDKRQRRLILEAIDVRRFITNDLTQSSSMPYCRAYLESGNQVVCTRERAGLTALRQRKAAFLRV